MRDYSSNWKDLGSVLVYQSPTFQFRSHVVITDFEECLIKKINANSLYHEINPKMIVPHNGEFLKQIKKEAVEYSIVIISNTPGGGKVITDSIKYKMELFSELYEIPVLALFAVKKNRLSKPHTGMWTFLTGYFKKMGDSHIQKACVVSDYGGRIEEYTTARGFTKIRADSTDSDRAFAHNIDVPYHTIAEYLNAEKAEMFNWNSNCLSPEIREVYVDRLSEYSNPNIFTELFKLGQHDKYMMMIYGAPRCGKTTLAKELVKKWKTSNYGKTHALLRFGLDKYSKTKRFTNIKKTLQDRISVIVDGGCHTPEQRRPYEELAAKTNTPILYIEVNPGLGMAYLFNHVAVETSLDENVELYGMNEYLFYKSKVVRPRGAVLYCPVIKRTKPVMCYRY